MYEKIWIVDGVNKEWGHKKGALHATQYQPTSIKGQTTGSANWANFAVTATMSNPEDNGSTIPLKTYKDTCRRHIIFHCM